ncbi:MAG: SMP-30/gluconolactonase/LRE family protein [Vicinamibacterales bacterium]
MRRRLLSAAVLVCVSGLAASLPAASGDVERLTPALDPILSVDAKLEVVRQDYFGAAEGPVWVRDGGYLLFSDMAANRIFRWDPAPKRLSVHAEKVGFTTMDLTDVRVLDNGRLLVALHGSNGLALDREGRVVYCSHGGRSIVRIERDGTRTTLVDRWEGKRLNGPNDLAVKSDGSIYFSDMGSQLRGGAAKSPDREIDFQGAFRLRPDGTLQVISRTLTNGLAFSPDEKYLYTTGAGGGITRHDVQPDGSIANGALHVDMRNQTLKGNADGVRVDRHGYLFSSGPGGVWISAPDGTHIGTIYTPDRNASDNTTSVAFGDRDGRGLYITTVRSVYHIRLKRAAW